MTIKTVFLILMCIFLFEILPWPLHLIVAFLMLTKHTQNFVLKPLAKYWGARGISPTNYMERKLKNIREVIWFFAILLDIEFVLFVELFAIGISCKIINNLKNKMEISTSVFSKEDYTVYDEYLRENPPLVKDVFYGYDPEEYTEKEEHVQKQYMKDDNFKGQVTILGTKKEIKQEPIVEVKNKVEVEQKFEVKRERREEPKVEIPKTNMDLFNKPLEDIKTDFSINTTPIETTNRFDFDKPIGDISTSTNKSSIIDSKIEVEDDEVTCEKCGTVMSKNKIACPNCGELVKYKPKR